MRYESSFSGNYLTADLLGLGGKVICRQFNRSCSQWGFLHSPVSPAGAVAWQWLRRWLCARLRGSGDAHPSALCLPKPATPLGGGQGDVPWNIPDSLLSHLPLCSHSTPFMVYVKNRPKLRLIPGLLLWFWSEVRMITIKIKSPHPFLTLLKKNKHKGVKTNFIITWWFVKQKNPTGTGMAASASSSDEYCHRRLLPLQANLCFWKCFCWVQVRSQC